MEGVVETTPVVEATPIVADAKPERKVDKYEAKIKKEYLVVSSNPDASSLKRARDENDPLPEDELESKKCCSEKEGAKEGDEKNNQNGNEKKSKRKMRQEAKEEKTKNSICRAFVKGECPYGDKCKYKHNVEEYMANKPADIGSNCYLFEKYGKCPYGITCRFAGAHLKDNANVVNEEWAATHPREKEINILPRDLQFELQKKKKKFPRADPLIAKLREEKKNRSAETSKSNGDAAAENVNDTQNSENGGAQNIENTQKDVKMEEATTIHVQSEEGTFTDKEVKLRPQERRKIDYRDKLYLAPLTTIGNLPYRRICKDFGVDITCGEMAMAANLLQGQPSEWALLKKHPSENLFGVQVCAAYPDQLTRCAELLEDTIDVDFIDINMGCPIDLVYNKGAGSALLENPRRIQDIVSNVNAVLSNSKIALTIKVRTGKDEKVPTVHKLFPKFEEWGASAVTIHGRSRLQRYSREADWDYIKKCVSLTNLPVIGNGDIFSHVDYLDHMEKTGVSTVMVARGAIIKPWIFTEIKERRHWDISSRERLDIIKDYCNYGLDHWGSDTEGVEKTRKFLLEWLSFLYRYIPVGIMEVLPPKINQRPPKFVGRDDLETLLASPEANDWVKISSMFLGPPPKKFEFTAKHKANSYSESNG